MYKRIHELYAANEKYKTPAPIENRTGIELVPASLIVPQDPIHSSHINQTPLNKIPASASEEMEGHSLKEKESLNHLQKIDSCNNSESAPAINSLGTVDTVDVEMGLANPSRSTPALSDSDKGTVGTISTGSSETIEASGLPAESQSGPSAPAGPVARDETAHDAKKGSPSDSNANPPNESQCASEPSTAVGGDQPSQDSQDDQDVQRARSQSKCIFQCPLF